MADPIILQGREHTVFLSKDVKLGVQVQFSGFNNIYGCQVGDHTRVGTFVEIQKGAIIGKNCKISSHSFICEGVTISDNCFVGHGVIFINDRLPKSVNEMGELKTDSDWHCEPTYVGKGVSIGSGAIIMCGIHIGEGALIGAGAVVTKDVPEKSTVAGIPARILGKESL